MSLKTHQDVVSLTDKLYITSTDYVDSYWGIINKNLLGKNTVSE